MTPAQLAALVRYRTQTNSTTFPDAEMLVYANMLIDDIGSKIAERNQGYFLVPATDNLVADQREYAFPSDVMNNVIKVEAMFASGDSYIPLIGIKDYRGSETESEIIKNYSNVEGEAQYTIRRRAFFLLTGTIIAVTDGLRIWYTQFPAHLANLTESSTDMSVDPSTTTAGFPRQFHELLARAIQIEYKSSKTKSLPLSPLENRYGKDLEIQLDAIAHIDLGLEIIGEEPSGSDQWDYGANL